MCAHVANHTPSDPKDNQTHQARNRAARAHEPSPSPFTPFDGSNSLGSSPLALLYNAIEAMAFATSGGSTTLPLLVVHVSPMSSASSTLKVVALIDTASSVSFIDARIATALGARDFTLENELLGGARSAVALTTRVSVCATATHGPTAKVDFSALVLDHTSSSLDIFVPSASWSRKAVIQLLIGQSHAAYIIMGAVRRGPGVVETSLGPLYLPENSATVTSLRTSARIRRSPRPRSPSSKTTASVRGNRAHELNEAVRANAQPVFCLPLFNIPFPPEHFE